MTWKSIALTKIMCLNLWNRTQVQLDCLDGLSVVKDTKRSIQLMRAVETMKIKALIISKSTYLLI